MDQVVDRNPSLPSTASQASARPTYIRDIWHVAMWSEDLSSGKPFARTLLDEPLVFFRKPDGSVTALTDRCPHRFAPLSQGTLLDGGARLQCPYHGLEFDGSGACVRNPHGGGNIPSTARVRSYPTLEKHSLIWIWMGDGTPTSSNFIPDYSCFDDAAPLHVTKRDHIVMRANYELITDNLLDLSHTSYLHDGILGNQDTVVAEMEVTQDGDILTIGRSSQDAAIPGLFKNLFPGVARVDKWNTIRWTAPGCMLIRTGVCRPGDEQARGTGFFGVHLLTPETSRTTHYHFAAVRWNVLTEGDEVNEEIREHLSTMRRYAFVEQDAPIIEAQQRMLDQSPEPLRPVILSIDAGPVRYRRILERVLRKTNVSTASADVSAV